MALTRILLDASAYSAFMGGDAWAVAAVREAGEIHLSAVVLGEMLAGFLSGRRAGKNRAGLVRFLESPRVSLVGIDEETAERYALILTTLRSAGTPIPTNDLWIAASAMQHGLRVLTRDRHFVRVPQIVVDLLP